MNFGRLPENFRPDHGGARAKAAEGLSGSAAEGMSALPLHWRGPGRPGGHPLTGQADLDSVAIRVPIEDGSLADLTALVGARL